MLKKRIELYTDKNGRPTLIQITAYNGAENPLSVARITGPGAAQVVEEWARMTANSTVFAREWNRVKVDQVTGTEDGPITLDKLRPLGLDVLDF